MTEANLDLESLKMWFWATLSLLGVLITILGWFIARRDKAITDTVERLDSVVQTLNILINKVVERDAILMPVFKEQLELHRQGIEKNAKDIAGIDLRLNTIETQHKDAYCRYPKLNKNKKEE